MNKIFLFFLLLLNIQSFSQTVVEKYPVDSASVEMPDVPKGEIIKLNFKNSAIFPGTIRDYWIYVPAQYRPEKPACVYINQDGIQWKAPIVFDNLINQKEMPVTIGVFIMPGRMPVSDGETDQDRFNRSFEYDGLGADYARFILEEILPEVEKQKTADGRAIHLSKNGNDRAIGGSSSGAVCSFTAAWERPKEFSRVFSAIGTYVALRGADRYSSMVRKYEPKPIRFFLQDGTNDLNIYAGDWWKANETMERALIFSGYEVQHAWGTEGHNGNQGTAVFASAMRWLWKDWPKPVGTAVTTKNKYLQDILIPGKDWELVAQGYGFTEGIVANAAGEVFYQDIPNSKTFKVGLDGKITTLNINAKKASGTSFTTNGKRIVAAGATKQIISYDAMEKESVLADSISGNDLVVANNGNIYVTVPDGSEHPGKLYLIRQTGEKLLVDQGLKYPNGLVLTPDQTQLYVTESASHWVWIFKINRDGTLCNKQRYGWLHVSDDSENAWADGIKCDTAGRVYVTSKIGIQILDPLGRVNAILQVPGGQASNCCFGGALFNTLYVSCGDKIYRRVLNVRGANSFDAPVKTKKPAL